MKENRHKKPPKSFLRIWFGKKTAKTDPTTEKIIPPNNKNPTPFVLTSPFL